MPIVIDSRDLQRLRYRLEKASSDARRDMKRAMSSTQRATKTQAGRIMRETYTAGARAIANRTKLSPVDANALEFTLTGSKKPIELQEFKHSASKRHGAKVSVYQGGGTQQLPHAFKKSAGKSRLYQRIECTGIIRNTFQNSPWIEVTDFDILAEQLDSAVLTHLYRGEKFMEQRQWPRAIAELSLAPGEGVPQNAIRAANRNLGICLLRMGEPQTAISYLESASELGNGTDLEVENLLAMAKSAPEQALDRTVDSRGLKDSERPMWEAFDADKNRPATTRMMR